MSNQSSDDRVEVLVAATDSPLDRALIVRLNSISSSDGDHGECFEPLTRVLVESAAWLAVAAAIWAAAAYLALS